MTTQPMTENTHALAAAQLLTRAELSRRPTEEFFLIETAAALDWRIDVDAKKSEWISNYFQYIKQERGIE